MHNVLLRVKVRSWSHVVARLQDTKTSNGRLRNTTCTLGAWSPIDNFMGTHGCGRSMVIQFKDTPSAITSF